MRHHDEKSVRDDVSNVGSNGPLLAQVCRVEEEGTGGASSTPKHRQHTDVHQKDVKTLLMGMI